MTGVIYSIVTLGLGLLIGRAGMVSLCQFLLLAVGAWVALRLDYAVALPFPVLILVAGVVTGVIGTLIGLPALRLSGLYLALITLMAAGAITVVLRIAQFPNGGGGFFGNSPPAARRRACRARRSPPATRPTTGTASSWPGSCSCWRCGTSGASRAGLGGDPAEPGDRGCGRRQHHPLQAVGVRPGVVHGRAWREACWRPPAAASTSTSSRSRTRSLLLAVVLMGGVYSIWGRGRGRPAAAVPAGAPRRLGVSTELLTILFGIGILQVLLTAPGGLVDQVPKDLANLGAGVAQAAPVPSRANGAPGVIEVEGLTVRFGGVVPIDGMTVTLSGGTCGLIGPNGAGKTTFFNVLSGFVKPVSGAVAPSARTCSPSPFRRARWGCATFQTDQAIADLSVFENVLLVHENTGGERTTRRQRRDGRRRLRGAGAGGRPPGRCARRRRAAPGRGGAGRRAGRGSKLLDEPAAGLPDEETEHLGRLIRRIPEESEAYSSSTTTAPAARRWRSSRRAGRAGPSASVSRCRAAACPRRRFRFI